MAHDNPLGERAIFDDLGVDGLQHEQMMRNVAKRGKFVKYV
jgi:hypothetical protein